jgi:hypothetical protein
MKNKIPKSFYLVLIIAVIAISLVIFLQGKLPAQKESQPATPATQTTTKPSTSSDESQIDTSDWKTYRNEEYGFEFKYPKIYEEVKGCGLREKNSTIFLGNRIQIQIVDSQGLTLDEHVNKYVQTFRTDLGDRVESKRTTFINEVPAIVVGYRVGGMGRYGETVFLLHEEKIYKFSSFAGVPCVKDIIELVTLQQILSTFKFL